MSSFFFHTPQIIRYGSGVIAELFDLLSTIKPQKVLLVTDNGIVENGLADKAIDTLQSNGIEVAIYKDVIADPPEKIILEATELAKAEDVQCIIGLGGGSSLDVAKLVSVLFTEQQTLHEMYGVGNITTGRLPLILIPTTAGTGSEVTPVSIVTTGDAEKMGVVSPMILPDIALLDPDLTMNLPPHITAATGIDAMVHAIEAFASINPNNNPISQGLARQALRLMGSALETAVHEGSNKFARRDMLLGSMLAGQAFANSPVAAVHALAYPIGGHFKVPHGLSNALVLPHVLRFNIETTPEPYAEIAAEAFPHLADIENVYERAEAFIDELAALSKRCRLEQKLSDVGIKETDLEMLSKDAMNQTRLLVNNPRDIGEYDALTIYTAAL